MADVGFGAPGGSGVKKIKRGTNHCKLSALTGLKCLTNVFPASAESQGEAAALGKAACSCFIQIFERPAKR